jgi:hypothetical protein
MLGVARSAGGAAEPPHSWAAARGVPASNAINDALASKAAVVALLWCLDPALVMTALWHSQAEANLKFRLSLASG